jgi:hypothetical protein
VDLDAARIRNSSRFARRSETTSEIKINESFLGSSFRVPPEINNLHAIPSKRKELPQAEIDERT